MRTRLCRSRQQQKVPRNLQFGAAPKEGPTSRSTTKVRIPIVVASLAISSAITNFANERSRKRLSKKLRKLLLSLRLFQFSAGSARNPSRQELPQPSTVLNACWIGRRSRSRIWRNRKGLMRRQQPRRKRTGRQPRRSRRQQRRQPRRTKKRRQPRRRRTRS